MSIFLDVVLSDDLYYKCVILIITLSSKAKFPCCGIPARKLNFLLLNALIKFLRVVNHDLELKDSQIMVLRNTIRMKDYLPLKNVV